jgi:hypothetical protein
MLISMHKDPSSFLKGIFRDKEVPSKYSRNFLQVPYDVDDNKTCFITHHNTWNSQNISKVYTKGHHEYA